jgi:hypothetical protein
MTDAQFLALIAAILQSGKELTPAQGLEQAQHLITQAASFLGVAAVGKDDLPSPGELYHPIEKS